MFFNENISHFWLFIILIWHLRLYSILDYNLFYQILFFSALVNKGNCFFASGDYDKAKEYYQEAYNVEASCTEALFNLGAYENLNILQVLGQNKIQVKENST